MVVLSCFDGISCGRIALDRAKINVKKYYASEIDTYAELVSEKNYPDIERLGDITKWRDWKIETPDMIIGGSPCQGFSFAGKQLNFSDPRSKLFFTFCDILKYYKPKYFLLENVVMKQEYNDIISGLLGELYPECVTQPEIFRTGRLEPICINSALVSAQNRKRLYWTNIQGIEQPKDKGILLKDILENVGEGFIKSHGKMIDKQNKSQCLDANYFKGIDNRGQRTGIIFGAALRGRNEDNPANRTKGIDTKQRMEINTTGKANCLTTVSKDSLCIHIGNADIKGHGFKKESIQHLHKMPTMTSSSFEQNNFIKDDIQWRKLTPIECERLQTVPDNYTDCISNSRRYHALGNGWTVDVIAHIFSYIPQKV